MIWPLYLGAGFGFLFALLLIPPFVYCIPYSIWIGYKNTQGQYLHKKESSFIKDIPDATKVYISWITRKEPKI